MTYITLDEIKRVTIAVEKSVEVAPLLVARLSIAAVSCDSAELRCYAAAFVAGWAVAIVVEDYDFLSRRCLEFLVFFGINYSL